MFRSLVYRDFRLLLLSNLGGQLSTWSLNLAIGWLVFQITRSPFQIGLVFFFNGLAMMLLAPVGGTLADRFDRRQVIALSQLATTAAAVGLTILTISGSVVLWQVYLLSVGIAGLFAINSPSRQAMVYDLVALEDLANAVALNAITMNSMRIVGPAIGGVLLGTVGVQGAFVLMAAGSLWSAVQVLQIRTGRRAAARENPPFWESLRDGIAYARGERCIATLLALAAVFTVLGLSFGQLMSAYAGDVLGLGGGGFGMLTAIGGVGAVAGALLITGLGDFSGKGRMLMAAVAGNGIFLIGLGAFAHLGTAIVMLIGLGLASAVTMALSNVLLQTEAEDRYRGRVMALYFLTFGLQPLGSLPAGAVAEAIGLQATFAIMGAMILAATGWIAATSPHIRRL